MIVAGNGIGRDHLPIGGGVARAIRMCGEVHFHPRALVTPHDTDATGVIDHCRNIVVAHGGRRTNRQHIGRSPSGVIAAHAVIDPEFKFAICVIFLHIGDPERAGAVFGDHQRFGCATSHLDRKAGIECIGAAAVTIAKQFAALASWGRLAFVVCPNMRNNVKLIAIPQCIGHGGFAVINWRSCIGPGLCGPI